MHLKSLFASNSLFCVLSEIRTPIHGIIATAQLLETSAALNEEQQDYIQIIGRSAKALLSIINSILDFSKIEAGRVDLDIGSFNLHHLVNDAVKLLQNRASAQHNTLAAMLAKDVPFALIGDAGRVRQILINILANACKFTAKGFITVRVSVRDEKVDKLRLKAAHTEGREGECGLVRSHSSTKLKELGQAAKGPAKDSSTAVAASAVSASASALSAAHSADDAVAALSDVKTVLASLQPGAPATTKRASPVPSQDASRKAASAAPAASAAKMVKLRIEVEDTGPGIECKRLRQLFTPFSQADVSSTRVHGGTGLGLAIADRLVSVMKGTIGVYSVVDTGSIFWFDIALPVADDQSPPSSPPPLSAAPSTLMAVSLQLNDLIIGSGSAGKDHALERFVLQPAERPDQRQRTPSSSSDPSSENTADFLEETCKARQEAYDEYRLRTKIMVAEDNKVNQKVLSRMLERLGWTSEVANNGQEVIDKLQQDRDKDRPFQIVLMDCQMPVKDGMQATSEIRRLEGDNPSRARMWIIAVTADAIVGAADKYIAQGADDYLSKVRTILL